jgi:hypothetical protein
MWNKNMTRKDFLELVDRSRMTNSERTNAGLPLAEEDIRRVLDECYPYLKKSKEWENDRDG